MADSKAAPVTAQRVSEGLWRLALPIRVPPGHINSWLIEDGDHWLVVDCGVRHEKIRRIWRDFMASPLYRSGISRIVLTHGHPDHSGSAAWLARETGATVLMAEAEQQAMTSLWHEEPESRRRRHEWQTQWGATDSQRQASDQLYDGFAMGIPLIHTRIKTLQAGDTLMIGQQAWHLHAGYGHTPCNLLLHQPDRQILITGDQILPQIITNVSLWWKQAANPLAGYLASLQTLRQLPVSLALPAHGEPFDHYAARCDVIEATHQRRLSRLRESLATGPQSIDTLLDTLTGRAVHGPGYQLIAGQVFARLVYLQQQGRIVRDGADPVFRLTPGQ
ncbi:beta-lactamase domain-containing protein [Alcanivorax hongdengensis A-11-3]|uniref:Beta-lactamase domain-containing protein n=1 Tax=Alcanivorax hongdengensis A-11-3 TaxID=1177179 RepID=L0WCM9_9GAMM|nr:MBL fold metallo-hydrolase [Alcanivorax hongdengensis]EKF74711.1 beta-lactamase domain-containing protein [Alcanivorax hongdengensis A-11-3]